MKTNTKKHTVTKQLPNTFAMDLITRKSMTDIDLMDSVQQTQTIKKFPRDKNVRRSAGIACFRFNEQGKAEILLVKKRHTYNFVAFVLGQYGKNDDKRIRSLFNGMTSVEKNTIKSLRFEWMWWTIWLKQPERNINPEQLLEEKKNIEEESMWRYAYRKTATSNKINCETHSISHLKFYLKKRSKFSTFQEDNGKRLRRLMKGTTNADPIWEIPKGRKDPKETIRNCAIREFKEETGMGIDKYNMVFNINPIIESHTSMNITYINNYFFAYYPSPDVYFANLYMDYSTSEIDCIRWVALDEIKFLDRTHKLHNKVRKMFKIFMSKYKYIKNEK